jgi:hypothetical protein
VSKRPSSRRPSPEGRGLSGDGRFNGSLEGRPSFRRAAGYGRCVHEGGFLRVSNRHAAVAPTIEEGPGRYLGYFENKFGEQFVFVHEDGELDATVFGGDVGWERRRVREAGGLPDVGDLVLGEEERAFLRACWIATRGDVKMLGVLAERRSRPDPRGLTPSVGSRSWIGALCGVLRSSARAPRVIGQAISARWRPGRAPRSRSLRR